MKLIPFFLALLLLLSLCSCAVNRPDNLSTGGSDKEPSGSVDSNGDHLPDDSDAEHDNGLTPIYDDKAVVEAYRDGDTSALDEKQLAVYNAAIKAVGEFYSDALSEEETVLAAHDWIVTHTQYDTNMLLPIPFQTKESENPYGVFTKGQGICMGYTTTFQLFMDMLGVESIIVRGSSDGEEHAWNMVNLDGEWYHVDTTWDDFVPDEDDRPAFHLYCLVPDYVMTESGHEWNRDTAPKATAEDRIYYKTHGLYAENKSKCAELLRDAEAAGLTHAEIMTPSSEEVVRYMYSYWRNDFGEYTVTIYWID